MKALILQSVEQVLASERSARGREVRLPLVRSKRPGSAAVGQCQDLRRHFFSLTSTSGLR